MGEVRGGKLEKGGLYPSDRVLRTHWSAPILAHSAEKAESLPPIGPKSEAPGGVAPTPEQWRGAEVRNVSDSESPTSSS